VNRKVFIISENSPVPTDPRVWKEATSLHSAGYQVTVLCPKRKGLRGYEVIEGIHIYRHPMPREGNRKLGYLYEYGCALFWEFLYAWWIFLRRGFDVIQGCNPPDDIFLIALPFKLLGVRYIFDHHDVNPELYVSKYGKEGALYKVLVWLERMTYRFSDVVMATNSSYRELAISRGGVAPEDVFIVRNGPDLKTFRAVAPDPALKHGKPYLVGYVGHMAAQEGIDILLDAAGHIKSLGRRDVHFTCIGRGPALAELRHACAERLRSEQKAGSVRSDIDVVTMANGIVAIMLSLLMAVVQVGDEAAALYGDAVAAVFEAAVTSPPESRLRPGPGGARSKRR